MAAMNVPHLGLPFRRSKLMSCKEYSQLTASKGSTFGINCLWIKAMFFTISQWLNMTGILALGHFCPVQNCLQAVFAPKPSIRLEETFSKSQRSLRPFLPYPSFLPPSLHRCQMPALSLFYLLSALHPINFLHL